MSLDWTTLRELAAMTDRIGVLSLYATADPHDETGQPAWRLRARNELKRVREQVKTEASRSHWLAVSSRLEALDADVERLLDSRTPGLGRALFAPIGNGAVQTLTLQVPLTDHAALAPTALLRPLVTAWSAAAPAGAIAVSVDEIRVVDLRLGAVSELAVIPHPEELADRRELKGVAHSSPATSHQSSASHHDLFERREEERLIRYLQSVGPRIAGFAAEHGWECLALTGDVKYVQAVAAGLPPSFDPDVVTLPHTVTSLAPPKLAAVVEPALAGARRRRHASAATYVCDAALSGGAGACGLAATLQALQEGRVAHLLMASDGEWTGYRDADGSLVAGSATPGRVAEPRLDERMIELAFGEGAQISVLESVAAVPLAESGGIGAVLRW